MHAADHADFQRIEAEVQAEVEAAVAFAEGSPVPDAAALLEDIFLEP
jgi:TPP-dependent pyruvate/acetoin dehydrogenase alpha subunit